MSGLTELEARLDSATTALLVELRSTKVVNSSAMLEVNEVAEGAVSRLAEEELVPRVLTGKLWFVFTAMLTEADHAQSPDPILDAAWDYHERLIQVFGPRWG